MRCATNQGLLYRRSTNLDMLLTEMSSFSQLYGIWILKKGCLTFRAFYFDVDHCQICIQSSPYQKNQVTNIWWAWPGLFSFILFIYELGIGVYIHMKHSVLVQFIRWLCVQIRPKTDNEQLVCNFFSRMFSTTSCHSPVMLIMARK
jgi:hypothetical protein